MKKHINIFAILVFVVAFGFNVNLGFQSIPMFTDNIEQPHHTFDISFGNTAEAKSKFEKKWDRAVERIEDRTINHTVNRIEDRIEDHIDDVIDLLNPKSSAYRKWSMQRLFASLPYGETSVLVTGSKASTLKRIVNESSNATIVGNIYKRAANGKRGAKAGFIIMKSCDPNDIYIAE